MGGGGGGGSLPDNPAAQAQGQAQGSAWTAPNAAAVPYGTAVAPQPVNLPGAGVQTGIPQGGFAGPGIQQYFANQGQPVQLSYQPGQHEQWLGNVAENTQQGTQVLQQLGATGGGGGFLGPVGGTANPAASPEAAAYAAEHGGQVYTGPDGSVTPWQQITNPYTGIGAHVPNIGLVGALLPDGQSISDDAATTPTNGHWGGGADNSAANETSLIQSGLSDDDFWNAYEAGESNDTSWQNDGDPTNDLGNAGYGFTSIADMFDGGGPGASGDSFTGGIHGNTTVESIGGFTPNNDNDDDDGDSGGGGGGCVIGTYALENGQDLNRNGAVEWCTATLHDHWLGETVRLGYQHWGRKQISSGNAEARFNEFKSFADFVSGKDRSLWAGIKVYSRMSQCFAIGLVRRVINAL